MAQFEGYYQDASPKERKQLDKINDETLKLRKELADITRAASGNFEKIGSVLGKTTDEARTIGRQAAATTLRTKRQELERQLGSLQRQRQGFEQGILTRKAGDASEAIAKFVPADKNKALAIDLNKPQATQNVLAMEQQFQQAVQDPNLPYDAKLKMFVDLRKEAAFVDLANGKITSLNDVPGEGSIGAMVMNKANIEAIRASRPMGLDQIVAGATQLGPSGQTPPPGFSRQPGEAQVGGSPFSQDPGASQQTIPTQELVPPAGRQLAFRNTGPGGQIEGGTIAAPGGANVKSGFDSFQANQPLTQSVTPVVPGTGGIAEPNGPVTSPSYQRYQQTGTPVTEPRPVQPSATRFAGQVLGSVPGRVAEDVWNFAKNAAAPVAPVFQGAAEGIMGRPLGQSAPAPVATPQQAASAQAVPAPQPTPAPQDAVAVRVQQLLQSGVPPAQIAGELASRGIDPTLFGIR